MAKEPKYPVGEQSFVVLREEGFLYVDKTRFVEKIVKGNQYYFLGRPRRFGKSLFLSTLKCFFEGRRELFKGLYADTIDWDWEPYPVLHVALNTWDYSRPGMLDIAFNAHLIEWEKKYGVETILDDISSRFREVIRKAYESTGKRVVILVDEYDNPLVDALDNPELYEAYRAQLSAIYSNFKSSADYIRLVFLTGVSRFGKVSVFSGLNNIMDISMDQEFSDICGVTEQELDRCFAEGTERFAEAEGLSVQGARDVLKRNYDGYQFSRRKSGIYNPFSLLCVMRRKEISNYWIQSGQTQFVANKIASGNFDVEELLNSQCSATELIGIEPFDINPLALLYQSGYLTIKDYDKELGIFTLGLPNDEVKKGLIDNLLPQYSSINEKQTALEISRFVKEIRDGDADGFMRRMQSLFAGYSYEMRLENENNFHNVIYMLALLLGLQVEVERKTSDGRVDLLITTDRYRYVMEIKVDSTPEAALRQINDKHYQLQFATDSRTVIKIGANFSTALRRLTGWIVEMGS